MRRWLLMLVSIALIAQIIGCEKTIREPGEPEHGGVFLHGNP
jgi:hypothetical protein